MWANSRKEPEVKYRNVYEELAEDLLEILGETIDVRLCNRLLSRSRELPTAAKPDALLSDVCETLVRDNFGKLITFRTQKYGACHMQAREVETIAEALKPLCVRYWPSLNVMLELERDCLFHPRNYAVVMGRHCFEEAPSVTFTRYLNDMERLKEIKSETYERNVPRIAQIYALNRVANIMPQYFHTGTDGRLKPGETIEAKKWAEVLSWRELTGIHTMADLLDEAGLS